MPLDAEEVEHLMTAEGYVELGMFIEAKDELEKIEPSQRHLAEVSEISLQIYQALNGLEFMDALTRRMVK